MYKKGKQNMEYLIFAIYMPVITQFIFSKPISSTNGSTRSHSFYKASAIINFIIGISGITIVNVFLRDKNIISPTLMWIIMGGFILIFLYGMYCVIKMLTTLN